MTITLYDLSGLDGRRFSPFGWRARMALAHKGLESGATVKLIRFSDKDKLAFSGQNLVPILVDRETIVADSWEIAQHLEATYPNAPSLFGGEAAEGGARLVAAYVDSQLHPLVARCVVKDIANIIHGDDLPYFRESREKRFGMTLEQTIADREETRSQLKIALYPVRTALKERLFLGGSSPTFADYAVFGAFMWARVVSDFKMLETEDPIYTWRERMLDLYDAMPRNQPGYPF